MNDKFWKAALAVGGVAAIGAFVFWSLYQQWLSLPIFSRMSPDQTFYIMILFLGLVFLALITLVFAYFLKGSSTGSGSNSEHAFKLHECWKGVNEIDCERLVGPDVVSAANAMKITASSWLNSLVDKEIIFQNHFDDYEALYNEIMTCDKVVPGFEKKGLKCPDLVSAEMKAAYEQMKQRQNQR